MDSNARCSVARKPSLTTAESDLVGHLGPYRLLSSRTRIAVIPVDDDSASRGDRQWGAEPLCSPTKRSR